MPLESQLREPSSGGASLAAIAVELLAAGPRRRPYPGAWHGVLTPVQLADGARRAIAIRLAGIYRLGLKELDAAEAAGGSIVDELDRAQRAEVADSLVASQQTGEVLRAMLARGIRPVVLKGWSLAERLWPAPWMRPPGDVDLLIEEEALGGTVSVLAQLGLHPTQGEAPGRWRPAPSGIDAWRSGPGVSVDVHTQLFRTVGSGLSARDVLSRALPASLLGLSVRLLAPADEILFLLVHAAKHGAVRTKWLLDLHAVRLAHAPEAWAEAAERAIASGATRPVWAAARLLGRQSPLPPRLERVLRPPLHARAVISGLVRPSESTPRRLLAQPVSYALEWFLEDRLKHRITRLAGVMERLLGAALENVPGERPVTGTESRSLQWIAAALRRGQGPLWVTLKGSSMAPSVGPNDAVLVAPVRPGDTLREGDLLLARRADILVVHRMVRRIGSEIVMRGDGAWNDDSPLPESDILARVIEIRHARAEGPATIERETANERHQADRPARG